MKYNPIGEKKSPIEEIILGMFDCFTRSVPNKDRVAKNWTNIIASKGFVESEICLVADALRTDLENPPSLKIFLDRLNNNRKFIGNNYENACPNSKKFPNCHGNGDMSVIDQKGNGLYVPSLCPCKTGFEGFRGKMKDEGWNISEAELGGLPADPIIKEFVI